MKTNALGRWMVETRHAHSWEDCWQEDDAPLRFPTRRAAEEAITEHLHACEENSLKYYRADFRVVRATS